MLLSTPTMAQTDSTAVSATQAETVVANKTEKKDKAKKEQVEKTYQKASAKAKKGKNVGDADAAKQALKAVIERFEASQADTVIREVVEQFSYDPSVAVSVAHDFAYRKNGGSAMDYAMKYVEKAIELNPNYSPAFLLMGQLYDSRTFFDEAKAMEWYGKAIVADPTNPAGYEGQAKYVRNTTVAALEELLQKAKQNIPTYPVNLRLANHLNLRYNSINKGELDNDGGETMNKLVKYMETAERDSMKVNDFSEFSSWFFGAGKLNGDYYVTGLNLAEEGISRFPDVEGSPALYRVAMFNAVARALFPRAVPFGEKLFAKPDTLVNANDYYYMARAYYGAHQYDKCIKACDDLIAQKDVTDDNRSYGVRTKANSYKELGDYEKADAVYGDYVNARRASGELNFADMWGYAGMYKEKALESAGQEMLDAYRKAFDLYGEAAPLDQEQSWKAYFTQIQLAEQFLDKEKEAGLGLKPAQSLYSYYASKASVDDSDKTYYIYASGYLGLYYFTVKKNRNAALPYFKKIYELDPTNKQANYVLGTIYKIKL